MKKYFLLLALIYCIRAHAQTYQWAKAIGDIVTGNLPNAGRALVTDASGNVYMSGNFKGSPVNFNPGQNPVNLSSGTSDVFFAKYSPAGNCLWAKGIIGSNGNGQSIAVDLSGNVYITGSFIGSNVDFDPGAGTALLTSVGVDGFIAKYDNNGNYIWARSFGGSSSDIAMAISLDVAGNVYVSGRFQSLNADFDPGPGVATLSTAGVFDIFIAKYDVNGNYLWARAIGGIGADASYAITTDAMGNAIITGNFQGATVDFDPGPGTATLTPLGTDIFFAKYDANGIYNWVRSIPGSSQGVGYSIKVDASGAFWLTGQFQGQNVDFDPGPGTTTLSAGPTGGLFFGKYDSGGNFIVARSIPNAGSTCIAPNASGKIYIIGGFSGTVDFDPGPGSGTLSAVGTGDFFFAKYDAAGNYIWAKSIDTPSNNYPNCITVDGSDNAYICGAFLGSNVDFDPGPGAAPLNATGAFHMFLAKYNYCSTSAVNQQSVCPGGSYSINNHTYTTVGLYTDTLYTAFGCDSLVLTQLTISGQQPALSISSYSVFCSGSSNTLTASGAVTYTWSTGAQSPGITVTPTLLAQYVVTGTGTNGCTGTTTVSALPLPSLSLSPTQTICKGQMVTMTVSGANSYSWSSGQQTPVISVSPNTTTIYTASGSFTTGCRSQQTVTINVSHCLSMNSSQTGNVKIKVYPNPARTELFYSLTSATKHRFTLTDLNGTVLAEGQESSATVRLDLSSYTAGIYNLHITIGKISGSTRFLIE